VCPVPLTVRGTQALVSFAPLAFRLVCAARHGQNAVRESELFPSPSSSSFKFSGFLSESLAFTVKHSTSIGGTLWAHNLSRVCRSVMSSNSLRVLAHQPEAASHGARPAASTTRVFYSKIEFKLLLHRSAMYTRCIDSNLESGRYISRVGRASRFLSLYKVLAGTVRYRKVRRVREQRLSAASPHLARYAVCARGHRGP